MVAPLSPSVNVLAIGKRWGAGSLLVLSQPGDAPDRLEQSLIVNSNAPPGIVWDSAT